MKKDTDDIAMATFIAEQRSNISTLSIMEGAPFREFATALLELAFRSGAVAGGKAVLDSYNEGQRA